MWNKHYDPIHNSPFHYVSILQMLDTNRGYVSFEIQKQIYQHALTSSHNLHFQSKLYKVTQRKMLALQHLSDSSLPCHHAWDIFY